MTSRLHNLRTLATIFSLLAVGCGREASEKPRAKTPSELPTQKAPVDAAPRVAVIPDNSRAAIVVVTESWDAAKGSLARFVRRDSTSSWERVREWQPAVIGHTGLAWGIGLHPNAKATGPIKREGDGKSSAGVFSLGPAYGYEKKNPGKGWPYYKLDEHWGCVDDPKRDDYNQIVPDHSSRDPKFKSAERMRRSDELYRWVIAIEHNGDESRKPTPGSGSCIFFHVWRDQDSPTVGCAALPVAQMEALVDWLDPKDQPVAILLPKPVYEQLDWALPPINDLPAR